MRDETAKMTPVELVAVRGDITEQDTDAVVNAANSSLLGGGGVDGAIHRAGGPEILAACRALRSSRYPGGLPTGESVATAAGLLPARWVIHTVGPVYAAAEDRSELLRSCYRTALTVADEVGAHSVAFPLISAGVYRWPLRDAVDQAIAAIRSADTSVDDVRLVLFGSEAYDAARRALRSFA
jgi:O-acetyl-ADP-ribose deacetylase (regulator of RNase III)